MNKKSVKTVAKIESLLTIGILLCSSGAYTLIAKDYLTGIACILAGAGLLYARGFIKD